MGADLMASPMGALAILAIAVLVHEPWRWLGIYLGSRISPSGAVFIWVKACATALVSALVMRLILFPAGALSHVHLGVRGLAFLAGVGLFLAFRKDLAVGVFGGAGVLVAAQLIFTQ